ncbi:respiratory nitrate reductase subunit gamma [Nocardia alni]|uniref:respiratory nitrate reductase subunit gamma n=1 Tax=Nocardia alni TaxID=2815723 RepID=UPI001C24904A|nr:respiratory nitrate reductase subunit gamma [Nocardia alni]
MASIVWIIAPYTAFASFWWGHWWRWRTDRFRSGLAGGRAETSHTGLWLLRIGLLVVLVPRAAEGVLGRTGSGLAPDISHVLAGTELAGTPIALIGAMLVLLPDMVGASTRPVTILDRMTLPILSIALITGAIVAFDPDSLAAKTLFVWFPSLFSGSPRAAEMVHAPFIYQARGLMVVLTIGIWPYTRLCGLFVLPIRRATRSIRGFVSRARLARAARAVQPPQQPGLGTVRNSRVWALRASRSSSAG